MGSRKSSFGDGEAERVPRSHLLLVDDDMMLRNMGKRMLQATKHAANEVAGGGLPSTAVSLRRWPLRIIRTPTPLRTRTFVHAYLSAPGEITYHKSIAA